MIVTNIRQQKNGRFAIYADGEYILSVDERTLSQSNIEKGGEVSQSELSTLADAAGAQKATDRAMTILSYRDHSKEELRRKLARTVGEEDADKAAQRMEELGLVNDESYAEKLAEELLERRLMGADRAVFELTRRGIDRAAAAKVVERFDTEPQERIARFLSKKYPQAANDEKERRRATAALSRNGFKWDDIREAMRNFEEEYE